MLVVSKFGGSSLSCVTQFEKVKNIVFSDDKRKIVVVSALGKRDSFDTKITDLLYILYDQLKNNRDFDAIWEMISSRFIDIKKDLGIKCNIEEDLSFIRNKLNKDIEVNYLVSRGEYLTAKLMSSYLGYHFVDAKEIIVFSDDGKLDEELTKSKVKEVFNKYGAIVVPGFYGGYKSGDIHLFSRGGSDVTGSILAKCISASLYENWTDVSGILKADPKIITNPKLIKEMTYNELRELSFMGATVLHEDTIFPVQSLNIPINLKNTNEPNHPGTMIKNNCSEIKKQITGMAGKKEYVAFNIFKKQMSNEIGILKNALSIFEKNNISIEHIHSGVDCISLITSNTMTEKWQYEIIKELSEALDAVVKIDNNIALIAIVGDNILGDSQIFTKLFKILTNENIDVKLIAQEPSKLSITIGVSIKDYNNAYKSIYYNLFAEE